MYQPKNYESLIGLMGLSEQLLKNHFSLYQGYVNNANKLFEMMDDFYEDPEEMQKPMYGELKRRLGWEFNGMRLHEYYFENLTKNFREPDQNSALYKKIIEDYENFANWENDFRAAALMRGIGWVILYYDKAHDCLINTWINEHDTGHLSGCAPLLVLDCFEHAYMLDYGVKRADYINAIYKSLCWQTAEKRFDQAIK